MKDPNVHTSHAPYLNKVFHDRPALVRQARIVLKNIDFDTMIGIGMSGALAIPTLAFTLRKRFAIIRKLVDVGYNRNHSGRRFEGEIGLKWIFVDDCVSSGATYQTVRQAIQEECLRTGHETLLIGVYTYSDPESSCWSPNPGYKSCLKTAS